MLVFRDLQFAFAFLGCFHIDQPAAFYQVEIRAKLESFPPKGTHIMCMDHTRVAQKRRRQVFVANGLCTSVT